MSVDNRLPTNQSQLDIVDKLDEIKDAIVQGGGGGSSTFAGLSDVNINTQTLANGQVPKWNSTTSKWENGNAGGGSGGHTILDDDGTALAQQDDLQFVGVYSTDNSTDGVTEVNIYREMTRAEYDLLSDDEKKGFINITDEPSVASIVDGVFYDTDNVIASGTLNSGSQTYVNWEYTATEDCFVGVSTGKVSNKDIKIYIDNRDVHNYGTGWTFDSIRDYIPVKKGQTYKITNLGNYASYVVLGIQQGSQVVKYNYSTEEQIVGTWFGEILYQKTIVLTNESFDNSGYYQIDLATLGIKNCFPDNTHSFYLFQTYERMFESMVQESNSDFTTNNYLYLKGASNRTIETAYVTIQYTKSS